MALAAVRGDITGTGLVEAFEDIDAFIARAGNNYIDMLESAPARVAELLEVAG